MTKRRRVSALPGAACGAVLLFAATAQAGQDRPLPLESRVPGGIAFVDLGPPTANEARVTFNDHRAPVLLRGGRRVAVIGIPLDTPPGLQTARLDYADGKPATTLVFEVTAKAYDEQRLTVTNQRHVDPSPQDLERIAA